MAVELADVIAKQADDLEAARALADEYVAEHESEFTELSKLDVVKLVGAVDVFRAAGLEESQHRVEVWLLHHFEPQNIGGPVDAQVRVVG